MKKLSRQATENQEVIAKYVVDSVSAENHKRECKLFGKIGFTCLSEAVKKQLSIRKSRANFCGSTTF